MKIVIDIRVLMDSQYSGVAEYVLNLLRAIFELDQINQYILFYNSSKPVKVPVFDYPNVRLVTRAIPNKVLNYLGFKLLQYPTIEKLIGEKFDLFFMPHLNFVALNHGQKSILTIHDLSFLRYPDFFSWRKNIWHWAINATGLIKRFNHVVAVSEATKRDLIEFSHIEPNKVSVIYGGVSNQYHPIDDQDQLNKVRLKYQLPEKFILFLGTVEPRKNLMALIKAYEILRRDQPDSANFALVIAGAKGWCSDEVFRAIDASDFKRDIKVLGYIDQADKPALYNLAELFAFPSFYEGFGFPPLEAMACGTPVVSAWGTSLAEIIGDSTLLTDPYNPQELAQALSTVINNRPLTQKLSQAGLKQAAKFNWSASAEQYLELFNKLG